MSIRIRCNEKGQAICAVCAAKTEPKPGDIYLDDGAHHALSTKFASDFNSMDAGNIPTDPVILELMEKEEAEDSPSLRWWNETYGD